MTTAALRTFAAEYVRQVRARILIVPQALIGAFLAYGLVLLITGTPA